MIKNIRYISFLVIVATAFVSAGCVTRTITVKTNPSNALVYIDDKLAGESPVTIPFIYYGTRKIVMEKRDEDGRLTHERTTVFEKIKAPVYDIFPLDFFSEVIWPREIEDEHILNYDLVKLEPLSRKEQQEKVIKNAEELRQRVDAPDF
ncbi:MAG: PEGA domain-containing protein [Candidatus Scalindua sp.]